MLYRVLADAVVVLHALFIVFSVLGGLLALRWLIAQTVRRPAGSNWQLSPDTSTGTTHIGSAAAVRPLAEEIEDYPGVRSTTASLTGPHQHPHLHLRVSADDHADISELRRRIGTDAIPRLTQALNLPALHADVLLRQRRVGRALDEMPAEVRSARTAEGAGLDLHEALDLATDWLL